MNRRFRQNIAGIFTTGICCVCQASLLAAEPTSLKPAAAKPAASSLDEQLLKSLDNQLLDDLGERTLKPAKGAVKPADVAEPKTGEAPAKRTDTKRVAPDDDARDAEPRPDEGEDIGAAAGENRLKQIERSMRSAEHRLGQSQQDRPASQMQQQALTELAALIREAQQKQSPASSGTKQAPKEQPKKPNSDKPDQGNDPSKSSQSADSPARESTNDLREHDAKATDAATLANLQKQLWVRLPPKVREQMLQSADEKVLPKYEALVEKYFRRLVEEDRERP